MKKKNLETETQPRTSADYTALSAQILDSILEDAGDDALQTNAGALYDEYAERYAREAADAAENVLGLAARKTGGYGNSYGATAAALAYNEYMKGLDDALEQRADRLTAQRYKALDAAEDLSKLAYSRERDAETDRKQALSEAYRAAEQGDYSFLEQLGVDTAAAKRRDALAEAKTLAGLGDDSGLAALGIDPSRARYAEDLDTALQLAKYGDYSALEALGVNTRNLRYRELLDQALSRAKYGDTSALEALGVNVEEFRREEQIEKLMRLNRIMQEEL